MWLMALSRSRSLAAASKSIASEALVISAFSSSCTAWLLPLQEAFGFLDQLVIAGQIDAVHARRAAALDLEQQAGPGAAVEHRIRTGAQQEGALQGVEGAVDGAGAGEGAEIDALGGLGAAMLQQLRKGMVLAQQDVGESSCRRDS